MAIAEPCGQPDRLQIAEHLDCQPGELPSGPFARSLFSRRHPCPLCVFLPWANGSEAPSPKGMCVCSAPSSPLPPARVLWRRTKSQVVQGACPSPVIQRGSLCPRGRSRTSLCSQITQEAGRPCPSVSRLNPAVPEPSAVSFY